MPSLTGSLVQENQQLMNQHAPLEHLAFLISNIISKSKPTDLSVSHGLWIWSEGKTCENQACNLFDPILSVVTYHRLY